MDEGGKAEKRRLERAGEESEKRGRASSRQNEFIKTATRLRLTSKETSFRGIVSRFPSLALRPSTVRIHTRAVYTIEATRVYGVKWRRHSVHVGRKVRADDREILLHKPPPVGERVPGVPAQINLFLIAR